MGRRPQDSGQRVERVMGSAGWTEGLGKRLRAELHYILHPHAGTHGAEGPSSFSVPAGRGPEKVHHPAHCEAEIFKGMLSIQAEHLQKVSLDPRGVIN